MTRTRLFIAVLCLFAAAPANSSSGQDKPRVTAEQLILPGEILDVDGKPGFVFLPEESQRLKPQPWIMYAPTLLPSYPDSHEKWMHEQFLAAGIAVAGVDIGEAYGSPAGCDALDKLYSLLVQQRGFATRPCLLGRSRGGLWVSSWAIRNPDKVAGIACIYPVFDLTTYPGVAQAAPAFGLAPEEFEKQLERFNPIRSVRKLADAKIPVAIIHGAIDKVVPLKQNSAQLKSIYSEAGQQSLVSLIVIDDQGHNHWPGFFNCQELVNFAIAKAKPDTTPNETMSKFSQPLAPTILLPDSVNVMAVCFSQNNRTLTTVATKGSVTVRVWDIVEGKLVREVTLDTKVDTNEDPIYEIQFLNGGLGLSQDAQRLVACAKGKVRIWNTEDGKLVQTLPNPVRDGRGIASRGLASTPDFSVICAALGTPGFLLNDAACEIAIWQGEGYGRIKRVSHPAATQITSLALSADGIRLASGSQNASTCVFELASGKLLYTLENLNQDSRHPDPAVTEAGANQVLCLAFSPDGKKLAIGDLLGVKIVDAASGELIHVMESPFRFGMSKLVFSSDGKLLARPATDKTVPIWSTESGKLLAELPTEAHDVAFSSDGAWFATGFTHDKQALSLWKFANDGQDLTLPATGRK